MRPSPIGSSGVRAPAAACAEIDLVRTNGDLQTLRLEPQWEFQMLGLGYLHPEWGHGVWKGESAVAGSVGTSR